MIRRYSIPLAAAAALALTIPAWAGDYSTSGESLDDDGHGHRMRIELTGYSYQDNTPPSSPRICCGVLHHRASGQGTYSDPITVAVAGSGSTMQFAPGTRFYLPSIRRYVIVEDSGASRYSLPHLDVWIDGRSGSKTDTEECMAQLTGRVSAIRNPDSDYPVIRGPIYAHGRCRIP